MISARRTCQRREMLQRTAIGVGVAAVLGTEVDGQGAAQPVTLSHGDTILFQGDSITDAGRARKSQQTANHPQGLGRGYPLHIAAALRRARPELDLQLLNRGISGNKVPDLADRWEADCTELAPNLLSILIGVNDLWHKLAGRYAGSVADYQDGFNDLLAATRKTLPQTTLVVCEPFVLRCGAVNEKWFPEFDERRAAARAVAKEQGAIWVPFQSMFDEAVAAGSTPAYWAADGVHPTLAGHALMADTWLKTLGLDG